MGETTKIAWTHHTFNPWIGCARVSPGCENCYAETQANFRKSWGVTWGIHGNRRPASEATWSDLLKWDRKAGIAGERRRVFCASLADVFEDRPELMPWRRRLQDTILGLRHLDVLLLTKRPENAVRLAVDGGWTGAWPKNVWCGTTVEDQKRADERLPHLLRIPAAVRFLSCEPLLGPVTLFGHPSPDDTGPWGVGWRETGVQRQTDYGSGVEHDSEHSPGVDWIILGSESGTGARSMKAEWARQLAVECRVAGVACFTKQIASDRGRLMKDRMGGDPRWWPEGPLGPDGEPTSWPREFPESAVTA